MRQLGAKGLTDLGRSPFGYALEVLDFEDRVRAHLGWPVVNVAVEPLTLGLEASEHALSDLDRHITAVRRRIDARTEQICGARLDVLHHQLQLLQTAVVALRFAVELAVGRVASPIFGVFLICARVPLDLLAQVAHLEPQGVDDGVKLRVEIVGLTDSASGLFRGSKYRSGHSQHHPFGGSREYRPAERDALDRDRVRRSDEQRANAALGEHLPPIRVQSDDGAIVLECFPDVWEEPSVDEEGSCRGVPNEEAAPVVAVQEARTGR